MSEINVGKLPEKVDFSKLLKKGWSAAQRDHAVFNKWKNYELSTEECIDFFKYHNKCRERTIPEDQFVEWIGTLGFKR